MSDIYTLLNNYMINLPVFKCFVFIFIKQFSSIFCCSS